MKKLFNLQLLADEAQPGAETNSNEAQEANKTQQVEEKKYTDKDVDEILDKKFADWAKRFNKEKDEAAKLAKMNAEEKAKYERDQLQAKVDAYEKQDALNKMSKTARGMLAEEGINLSDELISLLVSNDAEQTKTNVTSFVKLFKSELDKALKEAVKGTTPKRLSGNSTLSKDDIMKVENRAERQKLIRENMHLFQK